MLGRSVGDAIASNPRHELVAPEVRALLEEADLAVCNLECCISERGRPWPDPGKPFFFRAPPRAAEMLAELGVDCVTLANNHVLDFGEEALLDTLAHLAAAGVASAGAGPDDAAAAAPALLEARGLRLAVVAFADHPPEYAAGPGRPGIAFADLGGRALSGRLAEAVRDAAAAADALLVSPHWGPNMVAAPVARVRAAAAELEESAATLVAGHSAHVFHGVRGRVLYDLGDFVDDYAVDPVLRNDLGLLWLVDLEPGRAVRLEAVPLQLEFCRTRLATSAEAEWVGRRFAGACAALGTDVAVEEGRLVVDLRTVPRPGEPGQP
jgi:poly-gamma-glutamate synthesis protein (capsule biosynthesis protein)